VRAKKNSFNKQKKSCVPRRKKVNFKKRKRRREERKGGRGRGRGAIERLTHSFSNSDKIKMNKYAPTKK